DFFQGTQQAFGDVYLIADQNYDIQLYYSQIASSAQVKLSWSSPSTFKAVIPTTQLFSGRIEVTIAKTNGLDYLTWNAEPGKIYLVQFKPVLANGVWITISSPLAITSTSASFQVPATQAPGYFRVIEINPSDP